MSKSTEPEAKLDGQVERVTFHSEESGFCVLKVKVRGFKELIAVTGVAPTVGQGEWMSADGEWINDPRHGRQFKAQHIRLTQPDTLDGIERYLASDMVKGIGKEYAKRLVEAFGRDVFDVIENTSGKLEKVEGIGRVRRLRIKEAWDEQKAVRQIMTFLFSHGVSTMRAFRIFKAYGDKAIEVVQRDPYCLARDIRGIGFTIADSIAMKLGIAKDSELRARAGIEYVLGELTSQGHCAYEREGLLEKAVQILDINLNIVETALRHGVDHERLIEWTDSKDRDLIYLPKLYFAERTLAKDLAHLAAGPHPAPGINVPKAIEWVEQKIGFDLAPGQRDALRTAVTRKVMVITGGPGVGKTTLVNAVVKILRAKKLEVVLCAPTGRAAKRMTETSGLPAKTIHRLLQYNPRNGGFIHNADNPLVGDVFVLDETSMMDVNLAADLMQAIPRHAAVIWVGDVDQLPSVGPGCVLRDMIWSNCIPVAHLDEVFRQAAESRIITNAHAINHGQKVEFAASGEDSDCFFVEADAPERGVQLIRKMVNESIPRKFGFDPVRDVQVLCPMIKGELGVRNLNVELQKLLNPRGTEVERFGVTYRVGDKVMQTENDYDKDVYNGDIGVIDRIDLDEREARVRFDENRIVKYDFKELDSLQLSYATTIHKSQGSEYPCVVIPVHTQHFVMLQRNLIYTGLTRAKKLAILIGTNKALALAIRRADSRERVTTLIDRLRISFSAR
ncbi:ATP-dependent RecD-like DNA helicase [Verrucomicrobiota bacterium]